MGIQNSDDYEQHIVKLPKHDKHGNDVTNDKLGVGGRHRKDGSFSAMPYDFQQIDSDFDLDEYYNLKKQKEEIESRTKVLTKRAEIQSRIETATAIFNFFRDNPEIAKAGLDIAKYSRRKVKQAGKFILNWLLGNNPSNDSKTDSVQADNRQINTCAFENTENNINHTLYTNTANYYDNREEMSLEEAQNLLLEILKSFIDLKRKFDRLNHAKIDGNYIPAIDFNQMILSLSDYINKYPQIMDSSTTYKVMNLIDSDFDDAEKEKIREILKIDTN